MASRVVLKSPFNFSFFIFRETGFWDRRKILYQCSLGFRRGFFKVGHFILFWWGNVRGNLNPFWRRLVFKKIIPSVPQFPSNSDRCRFVPVRKDGKRDNFWGELMRLFFHKSRQFGQRRFELKRREINVSVVAWCITISNKTGIHVRIVLYATISRKFSLVLENLYTYYFLCSQLSIWEMHMAQVGIWRGRRSNSPLLKWSENWASVTKNCVFCCWPPPPLFFQKVSGNLPFRWKLGDAPPSLRIAA